MEKIKEIGKPELIEAYYALLAQSKTLVIRTCLTEMIERNKAIRFIQSKGLYGEFLKSCK